ncbi:MAG TPA: hypothetical protein VK277_10945 [Acidimicrobiales bacterium]|nr:hypothetical protein [Acidimicrobiales bacterium]
MSVDQTVVPAEATEDVGPATPPAGEPSTVRRDRRRRPVLVPYLVAGLSYLGLSVLLWWHVWSTHPTATTTCGCGDPALFLWFIEWPAYALTHGHNPLYSSALYHPGGIDLLSNTSVLGIGIPLAPVTLLFGPVATLNVASTLAPALSAIGAFWLARRYVRFTPAAWLAGLLYGFSPMMLDNLAFAHLMMAMLVLPPFIFGALDELLVRQRRRPVPVAIGAGVLVAAEFFISTEAVLIMVVAGVIGVALLVGYALVSHRAELRARLPGALVGLGVMLATTVLLLAYPVWYALRGRAHLSGLIWPGANIPAIGGNIVRDFVDGSSSSGQSTIQLGGYYGPIMRSTAYLGWGLIGVLLAGLCVWRKDRRLWFFGAFAVVTGSLTLGVGRPYFVPWKLLQHLPLMADVIEQRFMLVTYLAVAVMLAIVVDRSYALGASQGSPFSKLAPAARRAVGWGAAAVAALVALVPMVVAIAPTVPFTTEAVTIPTWYALAGEHLPSHSVVLAYPAPFSGIQSSMAWQAEDHLHFAMVGGGGPQGVADRAGPEKPAFILLAGLAIGFRPLPTGTPAQLAAVHRGLRGWQATTVVIPRLSARLAPIQRGNDPQYAAGFMTEVLGEAPVYQHDAWVWQPIHLAVGPLRVPAGTLVRCTTAVERRPFAPLGVPDCVLAAARAGRHTVATVGR